MTGSRDDGAPRDGDDLDSLVVQAPASAQRDPSGADDDIIDLRALTQLSASARPGAPESSADVAAKSVAPALRISSAPVMHADEDSYVPKRGSAFVWLVPLVIGFVAGMPAGAMLFGDRGAVTQTAPVAAAAAPMPLAAGAPPSAATAPAAAAASPDSRAEPSATGAKPHPAEHAAAAPSGEAARPAFSGAPSVGRAVYAPTATASATSYAPTPAPAAPVIQVAAVGGAVASPQAPVLTVAPADPVEQAFPDRKPPTSAAPEGAAKSVDALLDDAIAASEHPSLVAPQPRAAEPAVVPLAPSRQDVSDAMAVLVPAIRGCAMGQAGLATADIAAQSDGKVASVHVTGAPFEGASSGRCMEGVLRRARFPRFRQPMFRVQFPFAIQ